MSNHHNHGITPENLDIQSRAVSYLQALRRDDDMGAEVAQVMVGGLKNVAEVLSFIGAVGALVEGAFISGHEVAAHNDDGEDIDPAAAYEQWLRWAADQVEQAADQVEQAADQLNADDEN